MRKMNKIAMMGLRPALNQITEGAEVEMSGEFFQIKHGSSQETEKHPLHKYTLPNGTILYEKVQAVIKVPKCVPSLFVFTSLQWEKKEAWLSEDALWFLDEIAQICRNPYIVPPPEWASTPA